MPKDQVSIHEFMMQKKETREALRATFGIPRTGKTETIVDATGVGRCISDGTTYKDLEVLTFEKLLTYLGESTGDDNIHSLFNKAVVKIESPMIVLEDPKEPIELPKEEVIETTEEPSKEGDKCAKCEFRTASRVAMKMHFGRFHKDYN